MNTPMISLLFIQEGEGTKWAEARAGDWEIPAQFRHVYDQEKEEYVLVSCTVG